MTSIPTPVAPLRVGKREEAPAPAARKPRPTLGHLKEEIKEGCTVGGGKYKLHKLLGEGSFGFIHLGEQVDTGQKVAIKFEVANSSKPHTNERRSQLHNEYEVYRALKNCNHSGFPTVYEYQTTKSYNYMVMQLMGPNLETLMCPNGRAKGKPPPKLSLKTVLLVADQLLNLIEKLHDIGYVHRDIKPENIMMGAEPANRHIVHLLDMGLAKRYIDPRTKEHAPLVVHTSLSGTARYTGINSHLGFEQGRRDDLESLMFVLIYLACGRVLWQGFKGTRETKYARIERAKLSLHVEQMCQGLDKEFVQALEYCRSLKYHDKPDYAYLRKLLQQCATHNGYTYDYRYDWSSAAPTEEEEEEVAAPPAKRRATPPRKSDTSYSKSSREEDEEDEEEEDESEASDDDKGSESESSKPSTVSTREKRRSKKVVKPVVVALAKKNKKATSKSSDEDEEEETAPSKTVPTTAATSTKHSSTMADGSRSRATGTTSATSRQEAPTTTLNTSKNNNTSSGPPPTASVSNTATSTHGYRTRSYGRARSYRRS